MKCSFKSIIVRVSPLKFKENYSLLKHFILGLHSHFEDLFFFFWTFFHYYDRYHQWRARSFLLSFLLSFSQTTKTPRRKLRLHH